MEDTAGDATQPAHKPRIIDNTMYVGDRWTVRVSRAFVFWVERLILRYSVAGNPPVYHTADFPWAAEIESEWHLIRAELDTLLTRKDDLPGFHEVVSGVSDISNDSNWKTFLIYGYGLKSENALKACPETWRILQKIPGLVSGLFSIFEPGKHLPPHRGPYNGVLRFHLGLIVPDEPDKIGIRVDDQIRRWHEGEAMIFDDSHEHEAWNHSDKVRVVLFVDFVRPTRFPANVMNWLTLHLALLTPFVREGYVAQKNWEKLFFGKAKANHQ
jgi:ornithine lipid ester-linked acyl 2-hydroxylase